MLLLAVADDKFLVRTARSSRNPWWRLFFAIHVFDKRLFGRGASLQRQVVHLDCLFEAIVLARLRLLNAKIEGANDGLVEGAEPGPIGVPMGADAVQA